MKNSMNVKSDILDVDSLEVSNWFDIDFENGQFIYCAIRSEDESGNFLTMPKGVDLKKVMKNLPDTTDSVFSPDKKRYRELTKEELVDISNL